MKIKKFSKKVSKNLTQIQPYQKEKIEAKEDYDRKKLEEEKRIKYDSNNLFENNKKTEITENIENYDNNLPIEVKKNKFFKNIIDFFKKFFKRK